MLTTERGVVQAIGGECRKVPRYSICNIVEIRAGADDNLCMLIEDGEQCRLEIGFSWRIKMHRNECCSAIESTDELRMLEHMSRRC